MLRSSAPIAAAAMLSIAAGCTRSAPMTDSSEDASSRAPLYSGWVVQVEDPLASFDAISFKDVGLMSIAPVDRDRVHEQLAQALATELADDAPMSLSAEVHYDLAMSLPETHLACAGGHIYVDLWDGSNPERFGYSLWSGCSEEGRFAWHEVVSEDEADRSTMLHSLARSIAGSIKKARKTGCFTRHC